MNTMKVIYHIKSVHDKMMMSTGGKSGEDI